MDRTDQLPSKDQLCGHCQLPIHPSDSRRHFGFYVAHTSERCVQLLQMEIERLRTALTGISTCSTCEACRGAALRALRGEAFEIMRQLNMEPMQTCQPDWCPTCTKSYAECRCNGVAG
jgi:hypothetical protein